MRESYLRRIAVYNEEQNSQQGPQEFNMEFGRQELNDFIKNRVVYPEIYYKIQPFVMVCCDQMEAYGDSIPPQEVIDHMIEQIYNDVCRIYPDIAEYAREYDKTNKSPQIAEVINGFYRGRFRRRGMLRDIIGILLLSELFRRRRRFY
jgi:hypothetical protein